MLVVDDVSANVELLGALLRREGYAVLSASDGQEAHIRPGSADRSSEARGIVDVFDAITTARPYKPAWDLERAYEELSDEVRRGWRRKDLVEAFIAVREEEVPS